MGTFMVPLWDSPLHRYTQCPLKEGPFGVSRRRVLYLGIGNTSLNTPWARSNLVDPASSHMLVSKIKPCMSKYKYHTAKLRMAH